MDRTSDIEIIKAELDDLSNPISNYYAPIMEKQLKLVRNTCVADVKLHCDPLGTLSYMSYDSIDSILPDIVPPKSKHSGIFRLLCNMHHNMFSHDSDDDEEEEDEEDSAKKSDGDSKGEVGDKRDPKKDCNHHHKPDDGIDTHPHNPPEENMDGDKHHHHHESKEFYTSLGFGSSVDKCMFDHIQDLSPSCHNAIMDLKNTRSMYLSSSSPDSEHHGHGFAVIFIILFVVLVLKRLRYRSYFKKIRTIMDAIRSDPALKAAIEEKVNFPIPERPVHHQFGWFGKIIGGILAAFVVVMITFLISGLLLSIAYGPDNQNIPGGVVIFTLLSVLALICMIAYRIFKRVHRNVENSVNAGHGNQNINGGDLNNGSNEQPSHFSSLMSRWTSPSAPSGYVLLSTNANVMPNAGTEMVSQSRGPSEGSGVPITVYPASIQAHPVSNFQVI